MSLVTGPRTTVNAGETETTADGSIANRGPSVEDDPAKMTKVSKSISVFLTVPISSSSYQRSLVERLGADSTSTERAWHPFVRQSACFKPSRRRARSTTERQDMMFFRVMLSAALGSGVAQAEGPSQIHLAYGDQLDTNGSVSSVSLAGAYHKLATHTLFDYVFLTKEPFPLSTSGMRHRCVSRGLPTMQLHRLSNGGRRAARRK